MNDEFSSRKSLYSKKYEATTVTTMFKRIFILKGQHDKELFERAELNNTTIVQTLHSTIDTEAKEA